MRSLVKIFALVLVLLTGLVVFAQPEEEVNEDKQASEIDAKDLIGVWSIVALDDKPIHEKLGLWLDFEDEGVLDIKSDGDNCLTNWTIEGNVIKAYTSGEEEDPEEWEIVEFEKESVLKLKHEGKLVSCKFE